MFIFLLFSFNESFYLLSKVSFFSWVSFHNFLLIMLHLKKKISKIAGYLFISFKIFLWNTEKNEIIIFFYIFQWYFVLCWIKKFFIFSIFMFGCKSEFTMQFPMGILFLECSYTPRGISLSSTYYHECVFIEYKDALC